LAKGSSLCNANVTVFHFTRMYIYPCVYEYWFQGEGTFLHPFFCHGQRSIRRAEMARSHCAARTRDGRPSQSTSTMQLLHTRGPTAFCIPALTPKECTRYCATRIGATASFPHGEVDLCIKAAVSFTASLPQENMREPLVMSVDPFRPN
jgi:hypothetical protein